MMIILYPPILFHNIFFLRGFNDRVEPHNVKFFGAVCLDCNTGLIFGIPINFPTTEC